MAETKEPCRPVKFCFLLGNASAGTVVMSQRAYKDDAMSRTYFRVVPLFIDGHLSFENQPCSGWSSTSRTNGNTKTQELMLEWRHPIINKLINMIDESRSFYRRILSEKLRIKILPTFMPRLRTDNQNISLLNACRGLKEQLEVSLDLYSKVITGGKSWCHGTCKCGSREEKQRRGCYKASFRVSSNTASNSGRCAWTDGLLQVENTLNRIKA